MVTKAQGPADAPAAGPAGPNPKAAAAGAAAAGSGLRDRWRALQAEEPGIRARSAADRLGVSEAELVASRCGDGVRRLDGPWGSLVGELPGLGTVMALTRNDSVVHERVGQYAKAAIIQNTGLVLGETIDLRIFFGHWHFGFAVTEAVRSGTRRSLQFFDADGTAVHKVYLRAGGDADAYEALVGQHLHADQSSRQQVIPRLQPPPPRPDSDIDPSALRDRWLSLQDTHDFHPMLHELGAGRVQAFRLVPDAFAREIRRDGFQVALGQAAETGMPVMIFVGNPGVVQIHTGPVHRLKQVGPWFNVLDPDFSLHLREDLIASAWVVRKPTRDGIVTSVEIYTEDDRQIASMFGKRKPGEVEPDGWRSLVAALGS